MGWRKQGKGGEGRGGGREEMKGGGQVWPYVWCQVRRWGGGGGGEGKEYGWWVGYVRYSREQNQLAKWMYVSVCYAICGRGIVGDNPKMYPQPMTMCCLMRIFTF